MACDTVRAMCGYMRVENHNMAHVGNNICEKYPGRTGSGRNMFLYYTIIKINEFTKRMYADIMESLNSDPSHHHAWPYDQYYISSYVFRNRDSFFIFVPDILNTSVGKVLRHNWRKNETMYKDLNLILDTKYASDDDTSAFNPSEHYDSEPFPNKNPTGCEYLA